MATSFKICSCANVMIKMGPGSVHGQPGHILRKQEGSLLNSSSRFVGNLSGSGLVDPYFSRKQKQKQYCLLHMLKEGLRWSDTENMFGFHFYLPHDLGKVTWPLWCFVSSSVKGRWAFQLLGPPQGTYHDISQHTELHIVRTKDKGITKGWRRPAFISSPAHLLELTKRPSEVTAGDFSCLNQWAREYMVKVCFEFYHTNFSFGAETGGQVALWAMWLIKLLLWMVADWSPESNQQKA